MEKKTKKLQLRKETIAVLNGEKMTKVIGGDANISCFETEVFGVSGKEGEPLVQGCFCMDGYVFNPFQNKCIPLIVAATVVSFMVCPTFVVTDCRCR